jgi:hypothetical protein
MGVHNEVMKILIPSARSLSLSKCCPVTERSRSELVEVLPWSLIFRLDESELKDYFLTLIFVDILDRLLTFLLKAVTPFT